MKIGSKRTTTALAYWSDFPRLSAAALFALLTCAGATLFASEAYATTAAGRTKGSYAVSPTGAATYAIPIWAPAGPHGMQPHIALTYNSQQGNGYVGVGWGVSGLSAIYRCNLTIAQDGAAAPIALATSDGYCMDGWRLRLTGGTYGTANSTYQTEIANFVNVEALGAAGNGPATWQATDRNGWQYTYGGGGTTSNAQVLASGSTTAISWQLNEVTDPYGNTMTITYWTNNVTGLVVPNVISWVPASHGSSSYNYTMTFAYETGGSKHGYVGGTPFNNTNLLSSIAIAYQGTAVKTYYLTYTASSTTGRDTLTQVQECAGTGTGNCLWPTTTTYQAGAAGVGSGTAVSGGVENVISTAFDFNGDGRNDLIGTNSAGALLVAFGTATGYGTPVSAPSGASKAFGDPDGSGVAGILVNVSGTWYYYKWNGSAFAGTSTGITVTTAASPILADVNGDGRADFVYTDSSGIVHVRLSTSTAGTVSFSSTDINTGVGIAGFVVSAQIAGSNRALHFWGAAQADLLGTERTCAQYNAKGICIAYQYIYYALHFTGSTFSTAGLFPAPLSSPNPAVDFADYNDDGCTDILTATALLLSACNGTAPVSVALPTGVTAVGGMDWNGDGRRDVLVKQANGNLGVVLSTGAGLSSSVIGTSYSAASTSYTAAPNLTGDGQDGLIGWNGTSATYYLHSGSGSPPDLLTKVTDGYGNSASPTYTTLALGSGTVYTEGTSGAYPDPNYVGPMYVVSQTTFSDPTSTNGGTYTQSATYASALENLLGRGFDGFNTLSITDSRNNLKDSSSFEQIFPYAGMKSQDTVTESSATVSVTTNTPYNPPWGNTLSSTPHQERYFPYFSGSTTQRYELGGTENGDLITTASTNYTLDNYGNPTSVVTTVTDNDPNSPYTGQFWKTTVTNTPDESTSPYCLSLFTQTQSAYTATNGAAVTITKTLTPDLAHCDYSQVVTQSNSGSAYAVTEALLYDAFGNVNSDTVTGAGMSARLTSANWGTAGQFPASVTDPSGATTQFGYNFSYGLPSSMTDPNNLITSWQYTDGFGRKTQETRPDGTYTAWGYYACGSDGGCLLGNQTLAVSWHAYNTDGSVQTEGTTYYDELERRILWNQWMLASGTFSRNEVRYDSLGRTVQQAMPCTWTSVATTCTYWTTNTYDVLNRLTQSQRPISSTNGTLQTTTYAYAGRTTTVTDPLSNKKAVVQDVNGWLRRTTDPYNYYVTLGYDAAGNKTSVTDSLSNPLWSGSYAYGISAFLTGVTDMDRGSWTYTPDALGERTAWTDAKGQSFSATYDALSRPLTRKEPDLYTSWTWGSTPSAHNVGKLASVCTGTGTNPANCTTNPGYSETETYDTTGRLSNRAITLPSVGTYTYTWAYNATTGLLSTLTYPVSTGSYRLELQYGYQNAILQSITNVSDTPNVTVWTANTTNPAGQITQETLGNGIVTNRAYDAVTHWLNSVQSGVGGGAAAQNQSFLFDDMGNVIQRQDNNLGLTEGIWYDNDYRLSYSKLNGTQNLSVSYDATGDITARSDVAAGATWTYDPVKKHAVTQAGSSAFNYSYDPNGNAITRQGSSITWTSYNYPTVVSAGGGGTAETVSFLYGPDRQRWQQAYSGNSTTETTNYIGGLLEQVVGGGVTDYRHYIYAGNEAVAIYHRNSSGSNGTNYSLSDHEGSVASLNRGSDGSSIVNESYTPFGLRRNPTTWSGAAATADLTTSAGVTRQGYTFQTALGLWMGMNHMNGRVEDAVTGRFLSADPHIPDPTNTQSYNRYSYVINNPLTLVDPTGFDADCMNTGSGCSSGGDGDTLQEVVVTASKWPGPVVTQDPLDQIPGLAITGLQAGTPKQLPEETLPEVVVTAQKPKPQGKPNPILCGLARGAAGAAGAVAATATFATLTGNVEALNPAVLGAAAAVGFVGGVAGPGIVGSIVSGAASIATHVPSGYSPGGLTGMYNDALGGAASPAYAVPAGAAGGGAFGAVSGATGFADAGAVLSGAGAGGGALIGATAGGLAAAAGLSVTGIVYSLVAPAGCGP